MLEPVLSHPLILRVRRNHALEHATIHILAKRYRNLSVVGRSTPRGFTLVGDVPTESVVQAAEEALGRLKAGQRDLAVNPSCGTNFVTSGLLAGIGAFAVLTPRRRNLSEWLSRLPLVILVATVGLILGQRLGPILQAHLTTSAQMGNTQITGIVREERGLMILHHIETGG